MILWAVSVKLTTEQDERDPIRGSVVHLKSPLAVFASQGLKRYGIQF
jgi:hypothetical protein